MDRRSLVFLGLALVFLALGHALGESFSLWMKASHVCLECIGLG